MMTRRHHFHARRELLEVALFRRVHRTRTEERNDHVDQIRPPPNHIAVQVLSVGVVALVLKHLTDLEEALQLVQARHTLRALRHRELMRHLIAGSIAASTWAAVLAYE